MFFTFLKYVSVARILRALISEPSRFEVALNSVCNCLAVMLFSCIANVSMSVIVIVSTSIYPYISVSLCGLRAPHGFYTEIKNGVLFRAKLYIVRVPYINYIKI